ncbi:MAG: TetR/AcrR family transcriptional regulator C-terminal domain-containing protein [Clostridia bacterium]|nr:TetR/AcrR family transcriptional regulator C-terminal domain-containing protein [Clostridia bacterium]
MPNFTQTAIINTFGSMLERMPFDKITVSGIIKECSISRNTFYYHFRDIYDLLDHWLDQELSVYMTMAGEEDWEESVRVFLNRCKTRKKLIYNLTNSISRERLEQYFFTTSDNVISAFVKHRTEGRALSPQRLAAITNICRYSCAGYFLRFLWNGMKDDPEEIVNELRVLVNAAVEHGIEECDPE